MSTHQAYERSQQFTSFVGQAKRLSINRLFFELPAVSYRWTRSKSDFRELESGNDKNLLQASRMDGLTQPLTIY